MYRQRLSTRGMFARVAPQSISAARVGVLGLAVLCGACASQHGGHHGPTHIAGPRPQPQGQWQAKVEIEDDGLPTQFGPRAGSRIPDDPSEPWSPNYGKSAAAQQKAASAEPLQPRGAPKRPYERLSSMDEEAIIRRAIAEHEMRRN